MKLFIKSLALILFTSSCLMADSLDTLHSIIETTPNLIHYSYSQNPLNSEIDAIILSTEENYTQVHQCFIQDYRFEKKFIEQMELGETITDVNFNYFEDGAVSVSYIKSKEAINDINCQGLVPPPVAGFRGDIQVNIFADSKVQVYSLIWARYRFPLPIDPRSFFVLRIASADRPNIGSFIGNIPINSTSTEVKVATYNNLVGPGGTAIFSLIPNVISGANRFVGQPTTTTIRRPG